MKNSTRKILLLCIALLSIPTAHAADAQYDGSVNMNTRELWGAEQPESLLPLDTKYLFTRDHDGGTGTYELMSMIFEQDATTDYVYPWNLYVQTSLKASHGQGVGMYSRMYNLGTGDMWAPAIHAETIAKGSGTNIGVNAEMSPLSGFTGRSIGFVANAKDGYSDGAYVVNDHPDLWSETAYLVVNDGGVGWNEGFKIDDGANVGYGFRIKSGADANFGFSNESANTAVALYTGPAPIALRMNAGKKVCFTSTDKICMYYDGTNGKLQFENDGVNFGYMDTTKTTNNCMNC